MSLPGNQSEPVAGLYEVLITEQLNDQMAQLRAAGWKTIDADVSEESSPHVLARHLGQAIARRLRQLPPSQRVTMANAIIKALASIRQR